MVLVQIVVMSGSHAPRPRAFVKDSLHNEEWLREHYLTQNLNAAEIGRLLGVTRQSVHNAIRKFALPPRSLSEAKRGRPMPPWSDERRQQMRDLRTGVGNPAYGKPSQRRHVEFTGDGLEDQRRRARRSKHGVTQAQYNTMFEAQGGACAICRKPERVVRRRGAIQALPVDHDHATGRIRGLLCHRCNVALGYFGDDPALLRLAATYLESV